MTRTVHVPACVALAALAVLPEIGLCAPTPAARREVLSVPGRRKVTTAQAERAADLLDDADPFVRAAAEWTIARKVRQDNGGQETAWPRDNPPAWFTRWCGLSDAYRLEADYARQALALGDHTDARRLLASARKVLARAEAVARLARRDVSGPHAGPVDAALRRLRKQVEALADRAAAEPGEILAHRKAWIAIRKTARPIVLAHPAMRFDDLLFITRHAAHSHRNITGSQYPWVHKPGGDIVRLSGWRSGEVPRPVIDGRLGPGHVHGMDLWWDGDRVVFAYARQRDWPPPWDTVRGDHVHLLRSHQEPTHLYEIRLDGTAPRQLTDHAVWNDFEPTYCANGDVVFASDRSGRSSECGKFSADHTGINLYKVSADGKRLGRLTDNKDIDRYPHSLDNGLIAYTRWDYQERHFLEVHAIWSIRPDGTQADAVFNQHLRAPYGLRDVRSVPGSTHLVAVATGHHTFAYGPVVLVDPGLGVNTAEAIRIVTPGVRPQEGPMAGRPVPGGGVPDRGGVYQTPWALADDAFLVSYAYRHTSGTNGGDNASGFAIYAIDAYGNKELLHRDPLLSCSFPMPVRKRPRPPLLPDRTDPAKPYAVCHVPDVYEGFDGVEPGTVKYIRIAHRIPWPLDEKTGAKRWIPGNAWSRQFGFWSWAPVRVIGTVPVGADGSACFTVPADVALYFQALDANKMELRRMRTHVALKRGEVRGCTGCHETRNRTPEVTAAKKTAALSRPPEHPTPPPWGNRVLLGYETLIQPVLERHCVRCHGRKKPDGGLDLSAHRAPDGFLQSFRTLFGKAASNKRGKILVSCSNRLGDHHVSRLKEFGSHRSPFITVLLRDKLHVKEVKLKPAEWETLVTWVDANAPYYDTFFNKRPPGGGPPVRNVRLAPFPPFPPDE